jgi:hypothetical protein
VRWLTETLTKASWMPAIIRFCLCDRCLSNAGLNALVLETIKKGRFLGEEAAFFDGAEVAYFSISSIFCATGAEEAGF